MKKNTLWLIGGVGIILISAKSKIVDILTSIKRTFINEGTWEAETAKGASNDIGNYYPQRGANRTYYGTNYGITAQFLVDNFNILGIPLLDKWVIKNLTAEQAKNIWRLTVGNRVRYDEYKNQFVADFIFDWCVQRPSTCIEFMCKEVFGFSDSDTKAEINRAQFSDRLLNAINGSDPAGLYNSLKFWRLWHLTYTEVYRSFRQGVYNRIVRYDDYPRTPEVQDMINKAYAKAFNKQGVRGSKEPLKFPKVINIIT